VAARCEPRLLTHDKARRVAANIAKAAGLVATRLVQDVTGSLVTNGAHRFDQLAVAGTSTHATHV